MALRKNNTFIAQKRAKHKLHYPLYLGLKMIMNVRYFS